MKQVLTGTLLFVFCLLIGSCSLQAQSRQAVPAVAGVLDLREWDFDRDGSVGLVGEWAFFWQALHAPDAVPPTAYEYVTVPDNWTSYEQDGRSLPATGFATYRLTLYLPDPDQVYGLYIDGQGTAYKLWVDATLLAQNGRVADNRRDMVPESRSQTVYFKPDSQVTEIVVQISNFHHRKGGFRNEILIGQPAEIHAFQRNLWAQDAFSLGIFLVLGVYHLFIFAYRPTNIAPLYFALWCMLYFVRTGLLQENIFQSIIPGLDWELALRIEYLTFFFSAPPYALFIASLYPQDFPRLILRTVVGVGAVFSLSVLFVDTLPLSYVVPLYQSVIMAEIAYMVYFLAWILIKRRPEALYVALASAVIFAAVFLEILYVEDVISFRVNPAFGFLGFIFIQAILLSSRLSRSFHRVEALSGELEAANRSLHTSELKYRSIFEDSKDLIFIADLDGRILAANPAGKEILGYEPHELLQKNVDDLVVHQTDRERIDSIIRSEAFVRDYTLELRRRDGQIMLGLATVTLRKDEEGRISGIQGQIHDMSSRRRAETERRRAEEFEQMAFTDPLTKVYNRRFFEEIAANAWELSKRNGSPLAIVVLDIDHFKRINDNFGHLTGDQVLINVARLCQSHMRSSDTFARYGGEEFVILMPGTNQAAAYASVERLRRLVAEQPMARFEHHDIRITISAGIAGCGGEDHATTTELQTCVDRADQALYESKKAGRNRVTLATKR
jgi:diguanylate cyclase (GGDEF)-like protein/PAS domain S-box-containing protein